MRSAGGVQKGQGVVSRLEMVMGSRRLSAVDYLRGDGPAPCIHATITTLDGTPVGESAFDSRDRQRIALPSGKPNFPALWDMVAGLA